VVLRNFNKLFLAMPQEVHGTDEYAPMICMKSALTFASQAIGWTGKNMKRQLLKAQN
jgi:hypothetical protein